VSARLQDKVAFVTGAGGGIGSAICARLLAEGAKVLAVDIDLDRAERAIEGAAADAALAIRCDAGESSEVQKAVALAASTFGQLNVLCSVAGGSSLNDGIVTEAPEEEFWRVMRLDLFGTFLTCKHGIPELIKGGGGSVINMTSITALMGIPGRDCYTAAKGGVASLTRSLAVEYAEHGIRVNAIAPGMTNTARVAARRGSDRNRGIAERHLLGPAEPEDVASMAAYLASDEARMMTGHVLPVDSGVTIH
jgi:NAD(P)-dependent dehydrogenase (short-subunit alcohol dehydrogenase family)